MSDVRMVSWFNCDRDPGDPPLEIGISVDNRPYLTINNEPCNHEVGINPSEKSLKEIIGHLQAIHDELYGEEKNECE